MADLTDTLVTEIYRSLLLGTKALWTPLHLLLNGLPRLDQRSFLHSLLRSVSTHHLDANGKVDGKASIFAERSIRGVAAVLAGVMKDNLYLEECLSKWLMDTSGEASVLPLGTRRAAVAVFAADESKFESPADTNKLHQQTLFCSSCQWSLKGQFLCS